MRKVFVACAVLGAGAFPVFGQELESDPAPDRRIQHAEPIDPFSDPSALGDLVDGPCDVGAAIGETGVLGVATLNGLRFVSSRVLTGDGLNRVYVFDGCDLIDEFIQIGGAEADAWGYRDGMTDGVYVYFGWGGGIARHLPVPPYTGEMFITGGEPTNGTWRALAYDGDGNDGAGSFYTGDFGDPIHEYDMDGNLIRTFVNNDAWSVYGLAVDPCTKNLWATDYDYSQGTGALPPTICEIETVTGTKTGTCFEHDYGVPGGTGTYPIHGGADGTYGGEAGSGNFWDLVSLLQALSDSLVVSEVQTDPCLGGTWIEFEGSCPGPATLSVYGAPPGQRLQIAYSPETGNCTIPAGPCAGTVLNLRCAGARVVASPRADANGNARLTVQNCPQSFSGGYIQVFDNITCEKSNLIQIP